MENLRPLTLEEQLFATENHNLVYAFLQEKDLPEDVFYDVVIFGYMRAVQEYISGTRFRVYSFSTIAWKRMENSVSNYCRYLASPIRSATIVSLFSPIAADADLTWEDVLSKQDESILAFETQMLLKDLEQKMPKKEMKIIRMKVAGCKMHEIAKQEHLTFQEINELLANCKDDIIHILWGEERRVAA
ncbi:MAG: sigma-70 family RNA polymerase sigma factor [Clostridia bacterium]|nr:sigma-70 family RNA polymerase sigma factor [Clostridia bacterium]